MYSTPLAPKDFHQAVADHGAESRLSWLLEENARAEQGRLSLSAREEEELLSMTKPLSIKRAYTLFGMMLGTLPAVAIFFKVLDSMGGQWVYAAQLVLILLLFMAGICCVVGRAMGAVMGQWLAERKSASWMKAFFEALIAGIAWGAVTGAAGGAPAFGIGAVFGQAYAMSVGMVSFPLFAMLHRAVARGGMIDARHFWPLACGVVTIITALILGM
jgi:hypothetical protein